MESARYSPSGERRSPLDGGDAVLLCLAAVGEIERQSGRISNLSSSQVVLHSPGLTPKRFSAYWRTIGACSVKLPVVETTRTTNPQRRVVHYRWATLEYLPCNRRSRPVNSCQPKADLPATYAAVRGPRRCQPLVEGELIAGKKWLAVIVHAVMLTPANSGSMPTLLRLHGGPVAQHRYDFDIEQHIMASAGYRCRPEPSGSSGRGFDYQPFARRGVKPDGEDIRLITDTLLKETGDPCTSGLRMELWRHADQLRHDKSRHIK